MKIGIDPLIDCVFKRLFGITENKALLLDLLNSIMEESDEETIVDLEILNSYNPKTFLQDKMSIVDIKAKSLRGEWFIIEVQIQMSAYFPQRILYYWARMYQSQLQEAEKYWQLNKVTLISIVKGSLPINSSHYYNHFVIKEKHKDLLWCDDLHIHSLELSKFQLTQDDLSKSLEKWSYLLKHGENLDTENLPKHLVTPLIQKAVEELKMFTQDEIQREIYESRRKAIMDYNSMISEVERINLAKGREEGLAKGLEKGLEKSARNMIRKGMDIILIAELTGLSLDRLETIKKEML